MHIKYGPLNIWHHIVAHTIIRKLDAQIFLHKFYQSTCEIDAKAGTVLCMELVKALQKILLNISTDDEGYGYFGEKNVGSMSYNADGDGNHRTKQKIGDTFLPCDVLQGLFDDCNL